MSHLWDKIKSNDNYRRKTLGVTGMFTGRKIILEKPAREDAFYFQKWFLDKEFRHWYDSYMSVSLDMIEEEISKMKDITDPSADRVDFVVKNKRNGEIIGIASIKDIDRQNGHAEIALGIADENNRRAGFGVDLMIVLADILFYHFGFEKCYTKVNDNNRLGLKSAMSFGFTAEGKLRKHTFIDGQYIDQWILGMTREEYEGLAIVPKWKARA